ncbi:MAG: hypothetical protein NTV49_06270, partial [Kiritimatiellaeota bacterium]|nr:hypothetical protein [Kiritimatiellota bacterium]
MNYAPGILDYLAQSPDFTEVLLAPGAMPLQRAPDGMKSIGDTALNEQDVRDTLATLTTHAAGVSAGGKHGVFSFGMPQRGRFRVAFMTQRGSLVASIIKIPGEVPRVDQLVAADQAAAVEKNFLSFRSGLLLVAGPSSMLTNVLVYALLRSLSEQAQRVVFILEAGITFLLRHGRSLVLQSELGSDVDSIEEGLRAALTLEPSVIYIR